jgi:hypothetical protein
VKACKSMLCWFMPSRCIKHLRGRLTTLTLVRNTVDSLVLEDGAAISPTFLNVTVAMSLGEWNEVMSLLPNGSLRSRLESLLRSCSSIDRARVADALRAAEEISGARLVRR